MVEYEDIIIINEGLESTVPTYYVSICRNAELGTDFKRI